MEAAEATTVKALMQLHAPSSGMQRASRDKRLIRSMLQESKDTLLQSLSVTAQTGLQNASAHLAALHCLTAVQLSLPAPVSALPAVDAPPGFAPKPAEAPTAPSLALKLWPFGIGSEHETPPWPVNDPQPLLQLLRVRKVIASKSKQQLPQQLMLDAVQSASASHNPGLAKRLLADFNSATKLSCQPLSLKLQLLELKLKHNSGNLDGASAVEHLGKMLAPMLEKRTSSAPSDPQAASMQAQTLMQLAEWCGSQGNMLDRFDLPDATPHMHSQMLESLRQAATGGTDGPTPYCPTDASPHALCLAAAVKTVPTSASAWLAYADLLYNMSGPARITELPEASATGNGPTSSSSQETSQASSASSSAPDASSTYAVNQEQTTIEMIKAYCTYLKTDAQSVGHAGLPEDHMPVLLKLLQALSGDQISPEVLQALRCGIQMVPVMIWRAVVPQLFALLAHEQSGVWSLGRDLLQALELVDPAGVLYPALVESKRISKGLL